MNRIIIYKEDSDRLQEWVNNNNNDVSTINCPFKDIELVFIEHKDKPDRHLKLKCYRKDTYINFYVSVDGISKGKLRVSLNGEILQNKIEGNLSADQLESIYGAYFVLMDYITKYKPTNTLEVKEQKQIESKHKNSKKRVTSTTYLFHHFRGGSHSKRYTKPSHAFSVRGHYRHLKNGKTVWVKEYVKGEGKLKERTYKF